MPRIRYIKPEFSYDEELAKLPVECRLFYILLWTHSDRDGRCEDRPKKLGVLIFPYEPQHDADAILHQLHPHFVLRYEVDGKRYLQINREAWKKHQKPHVKEAESVIPAPPKHVTSTLPAPNQHHTSLPIMGMGNGDGDGEWGLGITDKTTAKAVDLSVMERRLPKWSKEYPGAIIANVPPDYCSWALKNVRRLSAKTIEALTVRVKAKQMEANGMSKKPHVARLS